MRLTLGISPCPNDTFIFHDLIHGLTDCRHEIVPSFHDVQELNRAAYAGAFDIVKVSFATYARLADSYALLPAGAALGRGNGPKLVARQTFDVEDMPNSRVVFPGRDTTAYLLSQILLPQPKESRFVLYDQVVPEILSGAADCGLIIHENRFTLDRDGLVEILDLGELWEREFHLPLPLGGIIAKNSLGAEVRQELGDAIQQSLTQAWAHPQHAKEFIIHHSREKSWDVVAQHIDLYVNEFSRTLGDEGHRAVAKMLELSTQKIEHQLKRFARP